MKRSLLSLIVVLMAIGALAIAPLSSEQVDVYYFHFTRRCQTCLNVEKVAKESVETLYPDQVKKGTITFQSINLDEKDGADLGKKCKVEGQTLIVICGDKRVYLTDKGFLYANGNPEKLKEEIKKAIEEVQK